MSFAPGYTPTTSFTNDESNSVAGRSTVRTTAVDVELANVSSSIIGLKSNLESIQRDDDKLRDFIVEPYALAESTRALVTTGGKPRGIWIANTAYFVGDVVENLGFAFICYAAHTSGSVFLSGGFWISISGDGTAATGAVSASNSAAAASTSALASQAAVNQANSSALQATTAANAASVSANSANTSALSAQVSSVQAGNSAAAVAAGAFWGNFAGQDNIPLMRYNTTTNAIEFVINGVVATGISTTNAVATFNFDANDYMQYDRTNNVWRWVIEGFTRFYSSPSRLMVWESRADEPAAGTSIVNRGTSSTVAGSVYSEVLNELDATKSTERILLSTDGSSSKEVYLTPIGVARNVTSQTLAMRLISGASAALVRMVLGTLTDDNSTQLQVSTLTAKGRAHTPRVNLASGGATVIFDFALTNVWGITLTTSITTMSVVKGANDGQTSQIRFKQDATGGRTVALPASFKVSGALNTSPNRVTILQVTFTADGNLFEGAWVQVPV